MKVVIKEAAIADFNELWPIVQGVVAAGDTYGFDPAMTREQGQRIWMELPLKTYVAEGQGEVLGTYYLKANQQGPGSHVCNCGYMVSPNARGKGLATLMCEHSQQQARSLGFSAMQFNFVASSNEGAVRLWQKLGFDIVGRLPKAFNHPTRGLVDALVMYQWLAQ